MLKKMQLNSTDNFINIFKSLNKRFQKNRNFFTSFISISLSKIIKIICISFRFNRFFKIRKVIFIITRVNIINFSKNWITIFFIFINFKRGSKIAFIKMFKKQKFTKKRPKKLFSKNYSFFCVSFRKFKKRFCKFFKSKIMNKNFNINKVRKIFNNRMAIYKTNKMKNFLRKKS